MARFIAAFWISDGAVQFVTTITFENDVKVPLLYLLRQSAKVRFFHPGCDPFEARLVCSCTIASFKAYSSGGVLL